MKVTRQSRSLTAFFLSLTVFILAILAIAALVANQRALTRGIPTGLPEPVAHADLGPFCINAPLARYSGEELEWALALITDGGFTWVRQTFPWAQIEPQPGEYHWEEWDRVVDAASDHGLQLVAVLDTAPAWAGTPPPADDFARFAAALAARYGERIDDYQVWHNPNLADNWGEDPNPAAYAQLLQQAATAIRAADPGAVIILGSLAPTAERGPHNLLETGFLDGLYAAGGAPYFDVLSAQLYGFDSGPDDRLVSANTLDFSRVILLHEAMLAHGDGDKPIWASHLGWNSLPSDWDDTPSAWGQVDEMTQAAYTVAALERARREWPWMGLLCLTHFQPDPAATVPPSGTPNADRHWGFAVIGPDGTIRPVYRAVADLAASSAAINYPGAYTPLSGIADWEGNWEFSALGADVSQAGGDRVTIPFWGTDLGLRVRRGHYRGTLYITVDGQPANSLPRDEEGHAYLSLTSPDYEPQVVTLPVAENLPAGEHVAVVVAERGWDQWALAGWSVAYHPDDTDYRYSLAALSLLAAVALAAAVVAIRRVSWGAPGRAGVAAWARLSAGTQLLLTAVTAALLWAAAWLTWGTGAGNAFRRLGDGTGIAAAVAAAGLFYYSPWFLLTLIAGLALFIIILLRLDLGLALIAALAPFYAFPWTLFDRAFSMAEIVTLMALVAWGMQRLSIWKSGTRKAALHPLDWAVLSLISVAFLSSCFAAYQRVAWRELRLVIVEPAIFYLMLRTARLKRRELWRILDFFVLGGVLVAIIGLVQYALGVNLITAEGGLARLRSVYGSPNNVGLYLGRVLPFLIAIPLFAQNRRRRIVYGLAALPVGAAILLSFSKGALLLGVPASLLTIGLLAGGGWLWATLTALLVAAVAAIPLLRLPRFASLLDTHGGTTFFRLKLWRATVTMIRDHPWLGVGPDNFLYYYRGRYILPTAWQEPDLSHPHNILLDHLARLGVLGAAAGVWIQVAFWRLALPLRRRRDPDGRALALGLMGAMADVLAHGLVDHSFFLIDLAFAFFLILGLTHALASGKLGE